MKVLFGIISAVLAAIIMFSSPCAAQEPPELSAKAAELLCVNNGEVLYSLNADSRHSMASTTKIMTALLLIEQATPFKTVTVTEQMSAVEGTSMGLLPGDKVTYNDLVHGMLLQSGNDAANTAAIAVAGSVPAFAAMMNERAVQIGMLNTHFVTPSGLDDGEHYTTAHDMALLAACAVKNPAFADICKKQKATLCYGNPPYRRTLTNHNRLLWSYDGAIGVKTGFTKKSGRCLVSAAERNGVILVAVTLGDPDDWNDHAALLDYGFSAVCAERCERRRYTAVVTGGNKKSVNVSVVDPPVLVNAKNVEELVLLPRFLYAPVEPGQIVGRVLYLSGGKTIGEACIAADEAAERLEQVPKKEDNGFFTNSAKKLKKYFVKQY